MAEPPDHDLGVQVLLSQLDQLDAARDRRKRYLGAAVAWTAIAAWMVVDALVSWPGGWPVPFIIMLASLGALGAVSWIGWYRARRDMQRRNDEMDMFGAPGP